MPVLEMVGESRTKEQETDRKNFLKHMGVYSVSNTSEPRERLNK